MWYSFTHFIFDLGILNKEIDDEGSDSRELANNSIFNSSLWLDKKDHIPSQALSFLPHCSFSAVLKGYCSELSDTGVIHLQDNQLHSYLKFALDFCCKSNFVVKVSKWTLPVYLINQTFLVLCHSFMQLFSIHRPIGSWK